MFEVWDRIYQLHKQDKYVCSLLMILVLINPDRQMPAEIKTELDRIDQIQDQYTEGTILFFSSGSLGQGRTRTCLVIKNVQMTLARKNILRS